MDVVLSRQEHPDYENVLDVNGDDDNSGRVRFINDDLNKENLHFRLSEALIQTLEAQKPGMPSSSFNHLFDTSEDTPPPHSTFAVFFPALPKHHCFPEEDEDKEEGDDAEDEEEAQQDAGQYDQRQHQQQQSKEDFDRRQAQQAPGHPTAEAASGKGEAADCGGEGCDHALSRPRNDTTTTSTSTATSTGLAADRAASAQSLSGTRLGALGDLEKSTQDESQDEVGLVSDSRPDMGPQQQQQQQQQQYLQRQESCDPVEMAGEVTPTASATSSSAAGATGRGGAASSEATTAIFSPSPSPSPCAATDTTGASPSGSDNRHLLHESSSVLDSCTVSAPLHHSGSSANTRRTRDPGTASEASSSPTVSLSPIRSFARSRGTTPPTATTTTAWGNGSRGALQSKHWQRSSAYNPATSRRQRPGHMRSSSLAGLTTALSRSTPVTPTKGQLATSASSRGGGGGGGGGVTNAATMLTEDEDTTMPARARSTTFTTPQARRKHSSLASTAASPFSWRGPRLPQQQQQQQQWRGSARGRSTSPESVVLGILQSMLDDQQAIDPEAGGADGACVDDHVGDGGGNGIGRAGGAGDLNKSTNSAHIGDAEGGNERGRVEQRRGRGNGSTTSSVRRSSPEQTDLSSHQPLVEGELASLPQRPLRQPSIHLRDLRKSQQQLRDIWQPSIRGNDHWAPPRHQVIYHVNNRSAMLKSEAMERQGFRCYNCGLKVELQHLYHKFRWCEYTGKYFCTSCHKLDKAYIPARILASWDFRRYPISKFAAGVLISIKDTPVFDVQALSPRLIRRVTALRKVIQLRVRLKSLRDYLVVCRLGQPLLDDLDASNSNIVLATSTFSLMQLIKVRSGQMYKDLKTLCKAWEEHVMGCSLCLAKAHICEFCNNDRDLLFPFQIQRVHKCPECKAISHLKCYSKRNKCPRCERRRRHRSSTVSTASMSSNA